MHAYIGNRFANVSPNKRIRLNVERAGIPFLISPSCCRSLLSVICIFGILFVRIKGIILMVLMVVVVVIFSVSRFIFMCVQCDNFYFVINWILNLIHPPRYVVCETTSVGVNCPFEFVGIGDVLVFINHGMETFINVACIGKVKVSFFNIIRVFRCYDSSMKHSICWYWSMNVAVVIAQHFSFVNVAWVYYPLTVFSLFRVENLKLCALINYELSYRKLGLKPQGYH